MKVLSIFVFAFSFIANVESYRLQGFNAETTFTYPGLNSLPINSFTCLRSKKMSLLSFGIPEVLTKALN